jgi:putative lipoprotein
MDQEMDMSTRWLKRGLALAVCGCVAAMAIAQEQPQAPQTPAKPDAPASPQAPERSHNNIRRAIEWKQFEYTCDAGVKVIVSLSGETAKVKFQDHTYLMKQARSADGNKYSDGKVAWWGKGDGGFLQDDTPAGYGKMLAENCRVRQQSNAQATTGVVSGTVAYRERLALPPNALVEVQLQDVSLADAPAKVIVEDKITLGDRQVPVPFELNFDPASIDPKHKYSVSARILVDGSLLFTNDKSYLVLTEGHPSHVDMMLKQVGTAQPRKP